MDAPGGPLSDLLRCVERFDRAGLPFMVVGAFAVMVHGAPRHSEDLDIVVHLPFEERDRVRPVVEDLGTGPVEERRDPQWGQRLVTPLASGLELEVFFTPPHPWYDAEFDRRVHIEVDDVAIPFISPEHLVLRKLVNAKLRTGQDISDAINVAKVQGKDLDVAYLRAHCGAHRVCERLEEVLGLAGLDRPA